MKVWIAEKIVGADSVLISVHSTAEGAIRTVRNVLKGLGDDYRETTPCHPYEEGELEFLAVDSFLLIGAVRSYAVLD